MLLFLSTGSQIGFAQSISSYLPTSISPVLENEIERLAAVSGMSNLYKPYSINAIQLHMENIRESYPKLYNRLRVALKPYSRDRAFTHLSASLAASDEHKALPNSRGRYTDSNLHAHVQGHWRFNDWFAVQLGGDVTQYTEDGLDNEYQASGSMISLGVDWAQLDIGYKDIWLSPFQGSAQLLSTQAQTMPSISLSNNVPIEIFGIKWSYLGFLSQMSRQQVQFRAGEFSDRKKPLLTGLHFSVQPTDWWSVGVSRAFQFGGGERPLSFSTLVRAFFDPRGADNDATIEEESGNQIASISSKMNFDGRLPFTFSLELAGEDTSNNKIYQLGNTAVTAGFYFPYFLSENLSLNYEYSDWQNGWYVNNVYAQGYVNEGFVLGNWAMQAQREADTAVFGTSHYLNAQWEQESGNVISAALRLAEHQDTNLVDFERAWELDLNYVFQWQKHLVTIGTYTGKDNFGDSFSQVKISLEY